MNASEIMLLFKAYFNNEKFKDSRRALHESFHSFDNVVLRTCIEVPLYMDSTSEEYNPFKSLENEDEKELSLKADLNENSNLHYICRIYEAISKMGIGTK